MKCAPKPTTAGDGRYTHPLEIRDARGKLVGYVAMCGCEPRYLDAEDVRKWDDPECWMDLEGWRDWLGGTLSDTIVTYPAGRPAQTLSCTPQRRPSGRPVPETPGPSAPSGESGSPLREPLRRPDTPKTSKEATKPHGRRRR